MKKANHVEDWQRKEIEIGIADLDAGCEVPHEEVVRMLCSWAEKAQMTTIG